MKHATKKKGSSATSTAPVTSDPLSRFDLSDQRELRELVGSLQDATKALDVATCAMHTLDVCGDDSWSITDEMDRVRGALRDLREGVWGAKLHLSRMGIIGLDAMNEETAPAEAAE